MTDHAGLAAVLASVLDRACADAEPIENVACRIADLALRTPLVPFRRDPPDREIRLKLETLQPTGSFKIRGAANAVSKLAATELADGVWTASAGNFAQGLAWAAARRGIDVRVHAPATAAAVKLDAIRGYGARVRVHPFADWWQIVERRTVEGERGAFVHPFLDADVILGNATLGAEILADWPDVDTIVVPFGGGGLAVGVAVAARALRRSVRVIACESSAATPLSAAWTAGRPVVVPFDTSTFITGIGSTGVLPAMWPLLQRFVAGVHVVTVPEVEAAVRCLAEMHHVIAEGAGAAALAAALDPRFEGQRVAAVISGANIDAAMLARLLTRSEDAPCGS